MTPLLLAAALSAAAPIDRQAVISRHNVTLTALDGERPLQVGNGEFAYGMDITGMQTFAPFNTMSNWGWHSSPPPGDQKPSDFEGQTWDTHGRPVRYPMPDPKRPELSLWLASNPHRVNLGRIGLAIRRKDGSLAEAQDIQNPKQTLDLWTGIVTSRFEIEGSPVTVTTIGHPTKDSVGFKIQSPLIREGRLSVFVACPGNNPLYMANFVGDWYNPGQLELQRSEANRATLSRKVDDLSYEVALLWEGEAKLRHPKDSKVNLQIDKAEYGSGTSWMPVTEIVARVVNDGKVHLRVGNNLGPDPAPGKPKMLRVTYRAGKHVQTATAKENEDLLIDADPDRHRFSLDPAGDTFAFTAAFSVKPSEPTTFEETQKASTKSWPAYWKSGAAIDLSGSSDPRWKELERRIVLSQYLMAVNEAGSQPPQESGLVNNGWYGRWHMEMVWWHAAHWYLWGRKEEAQGILGVYRRELARATETAKNQGYKGARWPKSIGPNGVEWPHEIHALLAWQQPHPIFFAEMEYRANPTIATLQKWAPIIEATADFMASYAFLENDRYVLGPPIHLVSENVDPKIAKNPAFELGYWRFGLRVAVDWGKRIGVPENPEWAKVLKGLAPLPQKDGVYELYEGVPDMWTKYNFEHPALTGTFGMLPGDGVDRATMARTLEKVSQTWNFGHTWGWDFPMLAMCAARLGRPEQALDFLLHPAPGFQFDERGLATGGPFPYFPSNGGLLYAIAMMAGGWDGAPSSPNPGFPKGWKAKSEGFRPAL